MRAKTKGAGMSERIPFPGRIRRLKELPVLPTLLTSANLAGGVTAILCASHEGMWLGYEMIFWGSIAILVSMVCDMFDGKVARMTGTQSEFGAELDSLADIVSFGVAPAMLVHRLVLGGSGVWGQGDRFIWLVTVVFPVLTAIRLARYNVEHDDEASDSFRGLPSPGAAALIISLVLFYAATMRDFSIGQGPSWIDPELFDSIFSATMPWVTLLTAILMVSTIRFPHIGNTIFSGHLGFRKIIALIFLVFLVLLAPATGLALLTLGYVMYGFVPGFIKAIRSWRAGRSLLEEEDDDSAHAVPKVEEGGSDDVAKVEYDERRG